MALTVDVGQVVLINRFPRVIQNNGANIGKDFAGWDTEPKFELGSTRVVYDETSGGFAELTYLKYEKGSTDVDLAVKDPVGINTATPLATSVTNDGGDVFLWGPIGIAIQTLDYGVMFTTAARTYYYGWFWTGGVAPQTIIAALAGNFTTSAACAVGALKLSDESGAAMKLATKAAGEATADTADLQMGPSACIMTATT